MVRTRSDIAFALCKLGIFSNNQTDTHWKALKRVLRCLAGTRNRGIVYGGVSDLICGYTDADWAGVWIRYLLPELGQQLDGPMTILGDVMGAIALAKHPIDHKRTRHINVSYHFVRERLTKALTLAKFSDFVDMLGLAEDSRRTIDWLDLDVAVSRGSVGMLQGPIPHMHSSYAYSHILFT